MEAISEPFDVKITLVGGTSVETTIEEWADMDDIRRHLRDVRTGWVMLGDVVLYSQNIITVQPIYGEDEA